MPSDSRCAVTFSRDAFRATPLVRLTMFPGGSLHTRQIRRNGSEEVTSSPTPYRNVTTFPGSSVRNSSRTCIREPLTAVWAGTLNSWMMRKSFRFVASRFCRTSTETLLQQLHAPDHLAVGVIAAQRSLAGRSGPSEVVRHP